MLLVSLAKVVELTIQQLIDSITIQGRPADLNCMRLYYVLLSLKKETELITQGRLQPSSRFYE
jgi:hypothetical protein